MAAHEESLRRLAVHDEQLIQSLLGIRLSGDKTAAITATLSGSALVGISIDALDHNANNGAGCQLHLRGSGTLDPSLRRITLTFSGTDCDGVYQNGSAVFTR